MGNVTFLTPPFIEQLVTSVAPHGRTLLELAGTFDVRLHTECRKGRCGACAVKVAVLGSSRSGRPVRLTKEEKKILFDAGKLTREQFEAEDLTASGPLWRLACQYVVRDEEILVAL